MNLSNIVTTIIPAWSLFLLAAIVMIHRFYVAYRFELATVSRYENVLYAIALLNLTVFYAGRMFQWWDLDTSIGISRLVWTWLLIVSLYISHRMVARKKANGLG